MTKLNFKLSPRAEAYLSGKEQIVQALTTLANHLHAPLPENRIDPAKVTAGDISNLKQAHYLIVEAAEKLGLELPCLDI